MFENAFKLIGASNANSIFGSPITPPNPALVDPISGISRLMIVGLQIFFAVAAISVLIYLLWGAFDWVNSGGDPERISGAQAKMTNAVIGLIMVIVSLTIFSVVAGDILGIVTRNDAGEWIFKLPSLNDGLPQASGASCNNNSGCQSGVCIKSAAQPVGFCQ